MIPGQKGFGTAFFQCFKKMFVAASRSDEKIIVNLFAFGL
jgi:hypothetical protein